MKNVAVAGMVGGGRLVRPSEASLAHGGVLFLEDVQDFSPAVLQALVAAGFGRRGPLLESGDFSHK